MRTAIWWLSSYETCHALEDLRRVFVRLGELRAVDGSVIPSDHLDVRLARSVRVPGTAGVKTFPWQPFLLERRENFALAKESTALIWLTIKAPDTAAPSASLCRQTSLKADSFCGAGLRPAGCGLL